MLMEYCCIKNIPCRVVLLFTTSAAAAAEDKINGAQHSENNIAYIFKSWRRS